MASNLVIDTTQFTIVTQEFTNPGGTVVSGLNYVLNLAAGTEIVAVLDDTGTAVNFASNVIGPISLAPGAKIKLHITIGISNLAAVTCPIYITGQMQDADNCVLAGTSLQSYTYNCLSCTDIQTCISAASAQPLAIKTSDYSVQTTDGVILADSGANTITLPANPLADQEFTIKNIDGATLSVSGNGSNIDGAASYSMTSLDESITVKFDTVSDEWRIIAKSLTTGKTTFTPTVFFATAGDSSFTYNTQTGTGYQIGNLYFFTVNLDFDTNAYTTATGAFKVDGLPVTPLVDTAVTLTNLGNAVVGTDEIFYAEADTNADIVIGVTSDSAPAAAADENQFPASTSNITFKISGFFEI